MQGLTQNVDKQNSEFGRLDGEDEVASSCLLAKYHRSGGDWLKKPKLIGELCYERLRGPDSYAFQFDASWLHNHVGIVLSADINNFSGMQYTQSGKDIFGC